MAVGLSPDKQRWQRVAAIVERAFELSGEELTAFLDEACAGNDDLRAEVEELLTAEHLADRFLETPAAEYAADILVPEADSARKEGSEIMATRFEGCQLGSYVLSRCLGRGGMGDVYLARDVRLKRRVAVKILPPELAADPERLERFRREALAVASLNHPHIVTLHSLQKEDGVRFLVMELVEGETLGPSIPADGLPLVEFFDIAVPLADAVAAAHARGITHRDLKPDNVMLDADGRVKVLDFGVAKLAEPLLGSTDTELPTLTRDGRIVGTVAYMSPEQVNGQGVDCRSDVFALGIVLYQMVTGRYPFVGESTAELISSILRDQPTTVCELRSELPEPLDAIVQRCLDKDPSRRFADAGRLRDALSDLSEEMTAGLLLERHTSNASIAHRRGWLLSATFTFLFLLLVSVGWWYGSRTHDITPEPTSKITDAEAVTSWSGEAWDYYEKALFKSYRGSDQEAIVFLRRAVDRDPEFAFGLATLGRLYLNVGDSIQARFYLWRALDLEERIPADQRDLVEGHFYATRWSDYSRAIEAFERYVKEYPEREAGRNNLAERYAVFERYDEAWEQYSLLIDRKTNFGPTYVSAANVLTALGKNDEGRRLLEGLAKSEGALAQLGLAWNRIDGSDFSAARRSLARSAKGLGETLFIPYTAWRLAVLQQNWNEADRQARTLRVFNDYYARWRGLIATARNLLYRGRSAEALERLDEAAGTHFGTYAAMSHCFAAEIGIHRGEYDDALAAATQARTEGNDDWPELKAMFLAAQAHEKLGESEAADTILEELKRRFDVRPNKVEKRQIRHLEGLMAFEREEYEQARRILIEAEALLPTRGVEFHWQALPDHVPIWFALGMTEHQAGRPEAAQPWFQKVVESGAEHIDFPLLWVRAHYYLGRTLGDRKAARPYFETFESLWQDGDMDRRQIKEAEGWLRRSPPVVRPSEAGSF